MNNFWNNLKLKNKPIIVLAPMADVTDSAFREIISECGKPDVLWTEFVSADGLVLAPEKGRQKLLKDLEYNKEKERPIVAQLFSGRPEMMEKASKIVLDLGFDGLDINMGCPDKSVEKQKAGAYLMKDPSLAKEIIFAAKSGVSDKIPVSIKTRIGYNKEELDDWLPNILSTNPALVTIHARTRKEMSKVPAKWDFVRRAVEIRDSLQSEKEEKTLIFGNGDVLSIDEANKLAKETGADGVMMGRAIFGNPWLFSNKEISNKERLLVLIKHIELFEQKLGDIKSFSVMKKHFKSYLSFLNNKDDILFHKKVHQLKDRLMESVDSREAVTFIKDFIKENN